MSKSSLDTAVLEEFDEFLETRLAEGLSREEIIAAAEQDRNVPCAHEEIPDYVDASLARVADDFVKHVADLYKDIAGNLGYLRASQGQGFRNAMALYGGQPERHRHAEDAVDFVVKASLTDRLMQEYGFDEQDEILFDSNFIGYVMQRGLDRAIDDIRQDIWEQAAIYQRLPTVGNLAPHIQRPALEKTMTDYRDRTFPYGHLLDPSGRMLSPEDDKYMATSMVTKTITEPNTQYGQVYLN